MMNNSRIPYSTVERWVSSNPCRELENGKILLCPARLNFPHLVTSQEQKNDDGTSRYNYNCVLLLPPCAGTANPPSGQVGSTLLPIWSRLSIEAFPKNVVQGQLTGLHSPFKEQASKLQYPGYTAGAVEFSVSTTRKPQIVDASGNPIPDSLVSDMGSNVPFDKARVYSGVWVIASLDAFPFGTGKGAKKKGVTFGLSSLMVIADDDYLGGAAPEDVKKSFSGVQIDAQFNAEAHFSAAQAPAPAPLVPASGPVVAAPMAPAPFFPPQSWPLGHDPAAMAAVGWTAAALIAQGYSAADCARYGVA